MWLYFPVRSFLTRCIDASPKKAAASIEKELEWNDRRRMTKRMAAVVIQFFRIFKIFTHVMKSLVDLFNFDFDFLLNCHLKVNGLLAGLMLSFFRGRCGGGRSCGRCGGGRSCGRCGGGRRRR